MKSSVRARLVGFTLVELMIVVVILGILAAVAIPAYSRYVKRSKTSEAAQMISGIYNCEVSYFNRVSETLGNPMAQFVSVSAQPAAVPLARRASGEWTAADWMVLGFSTDKSVYYSYDVVAGSSGAAATASIRATGDLDGNGATSRFQRIASVAGTEVVGGVIIGTNDME